MGYLYNILWNLEEFSNLLPGAVRIYVFEECVSIVTMKINRAG